MRVSGFVLVVLATLVAAATADAARFLVVYRGQDVPRDAGGQISRAGGTLVKAYDRIGVAVADSSDPAFLERLDGRSLVASVGNLGEVEGGRGNLLEPRVGRLANEPATDEDPFSPLQWDMGRIHVQAAHAITGGSPSVLVADLDTGVDYAHPELRDNLDLAKSVSCLDGVPNQAPDVNGNLPFGDTSGHGTHTAGTIMAADNGRGIVGVAPNVRLAAVKVVDAQGMIFPETVVCGYMWAATHGVDVVNTSFGIDKRVKDPARPERDRFYCLDDPAERAVIAAVNRAANCAIRHRVTLVASAGNNNTDLANPPAGNQCLRLPVEIPGVIGASSTTRNGQLTFNSNYGLGAIDVAAPGGDPFEPGLATPFDGLVLSTVPAFLAPPTPNPNRPQDGGGVYAYMFGTSQAAPHVTGVAALIVSRFRDEDGMDPGRVERILEGTAQPIACPPNPYTRVVGGTTFTTTCSGKDDFNGFFGHGEVDALAAVSVDRPGRPWPQAEGGG